MINYFHNIPIHSSEEEGESALKILPIYSNDTIEKRKIPFPRDDNTISEREGRKQGEEHCHS